MENLFIASFVVGGILVLFRYCLHRATIYEYETGLKYARGHFSGLLMAGQYWYFPWCTTITKIDIRPRSISVPGQEVLSSDSVGIKISLAVQFQVVDAAKAINKSQDYQAALYQELQVALRSIVSSKTMDETLEQRGQMGDTLKNMVEIKCQELGVQLQSVSIKDMMFPGPLKAIFTQVVKAKKEGLASLEKARGETAALRSLANAAQMIKGNPELLQLRALQSASSSSIVVGVPQQSGVIPISGQTSGHKDNSPSSS
ncbi:putative SPFH domain / Band 7 family [Candidatus Nitrospira nitrosa]|uniref:Putative SPFH domain / Band 7 family n=1 Tax=Candidatus Nitrospira nitrosa TaxID=1742972 RepID=A0A0S4L523_9BACT|nr:slipin family protein [Candidatus Nitrospira nitrosa]CUS31792.1 putative SPFH domain / Band 7 family [Candidatus Nitrospira nitrosa]